jgi:hypothetical protein
MSGQQSLWDEFIMSYEGNFDKLFASVVWKKALLPWLRAHRANRMETIVHSKDHINDDINKGMVIAYEMLINLPELIPAYKKKKAEEADSEKPAQGSITYYSEGLDWDEDDSVKS